MPFFTDQLGRTIEITTSPGRIVSLVPSQTELLASLELDDAVTGITKFCVHPQHWFRTKTRIGGTKNIKPDIIRQLAPDLIIANKEENVREQVELLARDYPVWISDVNDLNSALSMIRAVGELTGTGSKASAIADQITADFTTLLTAQQSIRTAYLIWKDPYMTVGGDTFIHDMLTRCGLHNIFGNSLRYPSISLEQLQAADCRLLLLSSEPYPFKQQHIDELQQYLPGTTIMLVDGEYFSWYGSRLLHASQYFRQLLLNLEIG
ncbi:MAG: helical backbone metal receptor [Chitinophagaceae bacterium]